MSLRVVHVMASLSPQRGGTTTALLHMIEALETEEISSEVVTTDDDGAGRLAPDAPERKAPGRTYVPRTAKFYGLATQLGVVLRRRATSADLIHVHGLFSYANGVAGRVARSMGIPYLVTPHGMANRYGMAHKRWMKKASVALVERRLLTRAGAVHMTSETEAEEFWDLGIDARSVTIPLPIEPVKIGEAETFLSKHPELSGKRRLLFVGRLDPIKNIGALMTAMAACQDAKSDVLLLVGSGPEEYVGRLREMARRLDLDVRFLGFLSGPDKADVLAAANLFVLPSLSESFGLSAVEALSAGLPLLLASRVAIGRELAAPGFAVLADPDPESLAVGLTKALHRLSDWDPAAARAFVRETYSPRVFATQMAALYRRVCA